MLNKDEFKCAVCQDVKKISAGVMGSYRKTPARLCRRCKYWQNKGLTPREIQRKIKKESKK
jgi:hypothetical protein